MTTRIEPRLVEAPQRTPVPARPSPKPAAPPDLFSPTKVPLLAHLPAATPAAGPLLKVTPLGKLVTASNKAPPASAQVQQDAKGQLSGVQSADLLAVRLTAAKRDPAVQDEMVRQVLTDPSKSGLLSVSSSYAPTVNSGFDTMKTIAGAVGHAWKSGAIDAKTVQQYERTLDPTSRKKFVETLAIDPANTGKGGVVEAAGVAAQALGDKGTAAIAFTSSSALIKAHLPTAAAQKAAFGEVKSFLDQVGPRAGDISDPENRNAAEQALASAARLTANGNGYTEPQLEQELKKLGPTVSGEAIARTIEGGGDGTVPGALDTLGKASIALASSDTKNVDGWNTNWALAVTATPQLIKADLKTPNDQLVAFGVLDKYLASNRAEWGQAASGDYSLLRLPEAVDGINRVLAGNPSLIGTLTDSKGALAPAKGQAELVQLFESVSLDPNVPQDKRDALNATVQQFIDKDLAVPSANAPTVGTQAGQLLGLIQLAGNRAVTAAGSSEKEPVTNLVSDFSKSVLSSLGGTLLDSTGPLGSALGGAVLDQVLDSVFGEKGVPQAPAELRAAFEQQLASVHIDPSAPDQLHKTLEDSLNAALVGLNNAYAAAKTPAEQKKISDQRVLFEQLAAHFDIGYLDTSTAGSATAVSTQLDTSGDKP